MSQTPFSSLSLPQGLLKTLPDLGYLSMTPIQAQSLPGILQGRDLIAQAKTGSGKTAAFGLGLLAQLDVKRFRIQSLVLCPTRELADQVANEIRKLGRGIHNIKVLTLCGGQPLGPQVGSLEHGAHIIVGTPGRVEDHLRKGSLDLSHLNMLVLDEADRMLEMGFEESMDAIIAQTPSARQTLLFSATYPENIQAIARRVLKEPLRVTAEEQHSSDHIDQRFYKVGGDTQRLQATRLLLLEAEPESALIFANTKRDVQSLSDSLRDHGFSTSALHGDLEQKDRDQTLVQFANKSINVLVATDVAARGLDIDKVDLVINYQPARDVEVHVHRVGRTGRAGSSGRACTLFGDREHQKIAQLQDYLEREIGSEPLPHPRLLEQQPRQPAMATIVIDGGKKDKLRPLDIVGALTGEYGVAADQVGKIQITPRRAFVAVNRQVAKKALKKLVEGKLKGRSFRARFMA